jgi:hypothetical protein
MQNKPSKLIPGLIGGAFIAFFSEVPILNFGNCLCCLWVVLGGFVGAWLYRRKLPDKTEMTSSDGAVVGLLSGVYGALFGAFLQYFFSFIGFSVSSTFFKTMSEYWKDMPKEFSDSLEQLRLYSEYSPFFVLIGLVVGLIRNAIFATAGGMLGAALFRKSGPAKPKKKQ